MFGSNKLHRFLSGLYALSLLLGLVRVDLTPLTALAANGTSAKLSLSLNGPDSISSVVATNASSHYTVGQVFPVSVVIDTDGAAAHTLQFKASWNPANFQFVTPAGVAATSIPDTAAYKGASKVLFNNYTVMPPGGPNVADNTAGTFTLVVGANATDTDPQIYATSDVTGPTSSPVFAGPDRVVTFYLKALTTVAPGAANIVFSTSADTTNQIIHYGEWGDLSGGVFTAQASSIYVDADNSGTVTTGDRRLTAVSAFAADSVVAGGDLDVGTALAAGRVAGATFRDSNSNGTRDAAEPVYLNLDYPTGASATLEGTVTAGDIRVIPGGVGTAGSTVASGDADLNGTLLPLANVKQTGTGGSGTDLISPDTLGTNLVGATVFVDAPTSASLSTVAAIATCLTGTGSGSTSTITATVRDASNNLLSGQSVTLSAGSASGVTITTSPATTNASGVATFTVSSATAQTVTFTATAGSTVITQTRQVQFGASTCGTPTITLSNSCLQNNGSSSSMNLIVSSGGIAISNASVTSISISPSSNVSISPSSGTTNSSGQIALTLNANFSAVTGSRTVLATVTPSGGPASSVATTITILNTACTTSGGMSASKTHSTNSPDFFVPGDTVNFQVPIRNGNATDATNVGLNDALEKGFTNFGTATVSSTGGSGGLVSSPSNGPLTVTGMTVTANSTRTASYTQDIKTGTGLLADFNINQAASPTNDPEWWAESVVASAVGKSSLNVNVNDATGALNNTVFSLGGSVSYVNDTTITRTSNSLRDSSNSTLNASYILLKFGKRIIVDGSGDDFVVITRNPTGDTDTTSEKYAVYASNKDDCNSFELVKDNNTGSHAFDLGDASVDWSSCILVIDQTNYSNATGPFPGVSVDAVGIVNLGVLLTNNATVSADGISSFTATDKVAVDIANDMSETFDPTTIIDSVLTLPPPPVTGTGTTLSIPADLTAAPGAEIVVPLHTTQGQGISDFALSIAYDPAKVTYLNVEPSTATANFEFIDNAIDGVNGMKELILGGNAINPIAVSGPADLALIHFRVASNATGSATFTLQNPINNIEQAALVNGRVSITAQNFTIAPNQNTIAITAGSFDGVVLGDVAANIRLAPSCSVYLSVAGLPSTITATFSQPTISSFDPLSVLWLDVASATPAGSYLATVTGSGISSGCTNVQSAPLLVVVTPPNGGQSLTSPDDLSLTVTSPRSGYVTRTPHVAISGTVGTAVAFLEANGTSVQLSPASSTWSADINLVEGENTVSLVAFDSARVRTTTGSITIVLDTEAPGPIRNLASTGSTLSWDAPRDNDIHGYIVYTKSGSKWKKLKTTSKKEFTAPASGTYAVTSVDDVGNESPVAHAPQLSTTSTDFTDVPADHFAAAAIAKLHARGIVQGSAGLFRPNDPVTRAEFAKMLLGARSVQADPSTNPFSDVSLSHPLAPFVTAAVKRGWATGQGENFFPGRAVSRYEASTMIVRAASLVPSETSAFSDIADPVERLMIGAIVKAGIASGQNGAFGPHRALTRAEAAKMLEKILVAS
jgi:Bacterial Ig-like domain (group 1)/S-layer homology domain/Glucodextranase, domain B